MIPASVTRATVLAAILKIDRDGVPPGRSSRGYDLLHEGRHYPPKYALAVAIEAVTGRPPGPEDLGGGEETNTFLTRLGFIVVPKGETAGQPVTSRDVHPGIVGLGSVRSGWPRVPQPRRDHE